MYRTGGISKLLRKLGGKAVGRGSGLSSTEFEQAFLRERALADRSLRSFSIIVLLSEESESLDRDRLAKLLQDRLRTSDDLGWLNDGVVALLLPETDESGANSMADALIHLLACAGHKFSFKVFVYKGRPGDRDNGDSSPPASPNDQDSSGGQGGDSPIDSLGQASFSNGRHANNGAPRPSHMRTPKEATPTATVGEQGDQWTQLGQVRSSVGNRGTHDLRPYCCEPLSFRRRTLDVLVSGGLLTGLSPLLLLVALLVKVTSPGPILFVQKRAGQGGVPFNFIKFRSMYVDAEARKAALADDNEKEGPIFKMKNDPRMTPIGKLIRRSSLDELPQLYNVLRGDMTLVGPRPPTLDEVEEYKPWQLGRLTVKGGLTCIWQVSGRSEVGFEDWVRMDLRYARERGLAKDLGLLVRTPVAVASGRGAY